MRFAPMSVKVWLALFVGVALIPTLAFSVFLLNRNNVAQEDMMATLADSTVAANVDAIDRQLSGMLTTMRALALSTALRSGDLDGFHKEAGTALEGTDSFLVVVDRQMNQLVNTSQPLGGPLGKVSDPAPLQESLRTEKPVISDGFFAKTSGKWVFYSAYPLDRPYGDAVALALAQNAESLGSALRMENLRGGWNAAIVDKKGIVLASTFMSSDVGKPFFLWQGMAEREAPQANVRFDGREYRVLTEKSGLTGWTVELWADATAIRRPIYRTYRMLLLGGLGLLAVSLAAAWLFGRQLSKSVSRLAEDARRMGLGQDVAARSFPVGELSTVSRALADAAKARRSAENEIRFLMREVAHRSKNQLTVISSLAKQSAAAAKTVEDFTEAFGQRILGLARSTDLLIAGSVSGVEMGELIKAQVEPFRPGDDADLKIVGPTFRMSAQAAQTVGLAVHELATNAAKYGALSTPGGELSVDWGVADGKLDLNWAETLPHEIEAPVRQGFGTRLIMRTLSGALGAEIDVRYGANGVSYGFTFPVDKLVEGPAAGPPKA